MEVLAIVPARGGSKRVPGKNWLEVGGQSLVAHAVRVAVECHLYTYVVTDCPMQCYDLGKQRGVTVMTEPIELADDFTPMAQVLRWALDRSAPVDYVCLLQPTSPLRRARDVEGCLRVARETGCDSVVTVTPRNRSVAGYIQHGFERNGAVYVVRPEILRDGDSCIGGHTVLYTMPPEVSVDVDTQQDLDEARRLWKERMR